MKTYRFDSSLVMGEMTEICAWARANNLTPETVPVDAKVTIDGGRLTVEVHVDYDGKPTRTPRIDSTRLTALRGTATVPLLVEPPLLKALKVVAAPRVTKEA